VRKFFKIEQCSCLHFFVIVHPMFEYVDLLWWIVVLALYMDLFVPVVVLVAVFFKESVGEKVAFADDDG
jgi:hypothetical protein